MSLFAIPSPPPISPTAPFIFDLADHCHYAPHDDGRYLTADLIEARSGWSWGGRWGWLRYDLNEPPETEEERESGGPFVTRAECLADCVAWLREALCECEVGLLDNEWDSMDTCGRCGR